MTSTLPPSTQPTPAKHPGHRLWIPIAIGVLAFGLLAWIRLRPELERNLKGWATLAICLVFALLMLLWFLLLSRTRWRTRGMVFAGLLVLGLVGRSLVRIQGTMDGTGLPNLVWRWTPTPSPLAAAPSTPPPAAIVNPTKWDPSAEVSQFFGPNRDGVVKSAAFGRDWSNTPPKLLWRQPIGPGWSAFAVVGGLAYTQEQRGPNEEISCYDVLTGRRVWTHANPVRFQQWQGGEGPRATPTVYQGKVYTYGATGVLDCLDALTGQRVWTRDVLGENKLPNLIWGISASPLVFDDTVVVTGGATNGPTLLAYRRTTGEPLWQSGTDKASYASPILATVAGQRVILSVNATSLTAHDPATGAIRLNVPWADDSWPKSSQPVVLSDDRVFLSTGYGLGCQLLKISALPGGQLQATTLWKNLRLKTQFNSVAARDGFLYGLDDGMLACVEISNGDRKWKDGRYGSGQTLLVEDLVLVQSEPGAVILAEAKPGGFRELARLDALHAKTWTHPTLAGRYLLVRNSEEVACYELPALSSSLGTAQR